MHDFSRVLKWGEGKSNLVRVTWGNPFKFAGFYCRYELK